MSVAAPFSWHYYTLPMTPGHGELPPDVWPDVLPLLHELGDAVLVVNNAWRIVQHNAAARQGLMKSAAAGDDAVLWDVWPASVTPPLVEHLRAAMTDRAAARVDHHELGPNGADVWLIVQIVPIATGIIVVARDITERKRHEAQARQLQELTAALSAARDPEDVGAAIIAHAMPTLGANAGNVFQLDSHDRELQNVALRGYEPDIQEWSRRLPLDGSSLVAEVVRTGEPILLATWEERIARYPHHRTVHARGGDRAVAGLPLQVEGRTIGALSLAFPTDRVFDENDRRFMATVADLCAQALDRARLYETVRQSETRFRQLADAMPQIVWVIDAGGTELQYLNQRWFVYTGADPKLGTAAETNAPIHPDDRPLAEDLWTQALRTGEPYTCELRLRAADGSYRWFLSRSVPVRDDQDTIVQWFGTSTDIDDTKRTEAKVLRLLEAGVIGIIVADAERIVEANGHFLNMVGYGQDDLASGRLRWADMTPPEFAELDVRSMAELRERGVSTPFEKVYIRRDGSRIPILLGSAVLQQDPFQAIGFILDLTERKRDEEEWRAFVDATAHDLRNPLTAVLGQTQLLQRRLRRERAIDPADVATRLATIAGAANRAAGLIDDLMDTVRLRAGQPLEFRLAELDLARMVNACVDEARRVGPSHDVRLESDRGAFMVQADGPRIERVIRNMLDNAIKYSPGGGEITVRIRRAADTSGSWADLSIQDRGIGIPAADLPHVFDRFHRGGNVAGRIAGSGIGLTGAQQIVAQHGGVIAAESIEGEGSTFTMRLPLVAGEG